MKYVLEPFLSAFPVWRTRPWVLALLLILSPGAFLAGRYAQVLSARMERAILLSVREFMGAEPPHDDMTLLVIGA